MLIRFELHINKIKYIYTHVFSSSLRPRITSYLRFSLYAASILGSPLALDIASLTAQANMAHFSGGCYSTGAAEGDYSSLVKGN
jgi:hypothetical protein